VESLDGITSWANGANEFVAEQAPLVAQEIIHRSMMFGLICCGYLAVIVSLPLLARRLWMWLGLCGPFDGVEKQLNAEMARFMLIGVYIVAGTVLFFVSLYGIERAVEAMVSPRLHVIRVVGEMLP
jgi:hypothetical protein